MALCLNNNSDYGGLTVSMAGYVFRLIKELPHPLHSPFICCRNLLERPLVCQVIIMLKVTRLTLVEPENADPFEVVSTLDVNFLCSSGD